MQNQPELLQYTDVMFDIETLGTEPNAPILSIAAVPFNPDNGLILHKEQCFHKFVSLEEEIGHGAHPSAQTLLWWLGQSDAARQSLIRGQESVGHPLHTIEALESFFDVHSIYPATVRVWGNGANFDITLLEAFFRRYDVDVPWKFYNVRCFRTLKQLINAVDTPGLTQPLVAHDALEDAMSQAVNAIRIIHALPVVARNV